MGRINVAPSVGGENEGPRPAVARSDIKSWIVVRFDKKKSSFFRMPTGLDKVIRRDQNSCTSRTPDYQAKIVLKFLSL